MNRGEEDYLKAIYEIESRHQHRGLITNLQLAEFFSHTAQTVNEMIKKLEKNKYIQYVPYKGSSLTDEGRQVAIRMIRVHRLWETFLVDKLGYSWEAVHEEAERLEHITSTLLEERLYYFLGEPQACPHGNIIPNEAYSFQSKSYQSVLLVEAKEGNSYCLQSVIDDKEILIYLSKLNLRIGQKFMVTRIDSTGEIIEIKVDKRSIFIGFKVARTMGVSECER